MLMFVSRFGVSRKSGTRAHMVVVVLRGCEVVGRREGVGRLRITQGHTLHVLLEVEYTGTQEVA